MPNILISPLYFWNIITPSLNFQDLIICQSSIKNLLLYADAGSLGASGLECLFFLGDLTETCLAIS